MLTRRLGLMTSICALTAAPALAQKRTAAPAPAARGGGAQGRHTKEPAITGSPAETPLGPVDTAARWAYIMDFEPGASLLEKQADAQRTKSAQ